MLKPAFAAVGVPVVPLGSSSRYDICVFRSAARLYNAFHPDVVHTHLPRADLVGWWLRRSIHNRHWVTSVHNIYDSFWPGSRFLAVVRAVWRGADAVIAISEAVKMWLTVKQGLSDTKVTRIYYGIDLERFDRPAPGRDAKETRAIVLSVGRLEPRKGHDTLIRALGPLSHHGDFEMRIVGGGSARVRRDLEALASKLRVGYSLRFLGERSDMADIYANAHVFTSASRSEGFGQVVVEAMASGLPVVASRIKAFEEIVVEGETGWLVGLDDHVGFAEAISATAADMALCKQMGIRGRERVGQFFSASRMAAETFALYQAVVGHGPTRA